jgi:hypothetical protein
MTFRVFWDVEPRSHEVGRRDYTALHPRRLFKLQTCSVFTLTMFCAKMGDGTTYRYVPPDNVSTTPIQQFIANSGFQVLVAFDGPLTIQIIQILILKVKLSAIDMQEPSRRGGTHPTHSRARH